MSNSEATDGPGPDEVTDLAEALLGRVRSRDLKTQTSYALDLRGKKWGDEGVLTMRYPRSSGWPRAGLTIDREEDAHSETVLKAYAEWLVGRLRTIRAVGQAPIPTVKEAAERLVEKLAQSPEFGLTHNTTKNARAALLGRVVPRYRSKPLTVLTKDEVSNWLGNLEVTKRRYGRKWCQPASAATKKNLKYFLTMLWRDQMPGNVSPPFAGVEVTAHSANAERRRAAERGVILAEEQRGAYSAEEVVELLAWAYHIDRRNIGLRPNVAVRCTPNTVHAIALQLGLGTRIEELMMLRRHHFDLENGVVWVPGTKTAAASRYVIIFDKVRPWVELALEMAPPEPEAFVFRVDPRDRRRNEEGREVAPSTKTYQNRIAQREEFAGLKFPRQNTHILRSTAITWMYAERMPDQTVKILVGHEATTGATKGYLNAEQFVRAIMADVPDIRGFMKNVPFPLEVVARAAELEAEDAYAQREEELEEEAQRRLRELPR